jgi:hypothetical protein
VFAIPMTWFEGELMFYLIYLYPFAFMLHFLPVDSPVILARIWLIMLIIVLG